MSTLTQGWTRVGRPAGRVDPRVGSGRVGSLSGDKVEALELVRSGMRLGVL